MNDIQIYISVREEILANHVLMHWFTLAVVGMLLVGVYVVENHRTILSVFLPVLSVAWAAAMVRFDFFIHRQMAYLRELAASMHNNGLSAPVWETWKESLVATPIVVPIADVILFLIVALPTAYVLTGPTQEYFRFRQWKGAKLYGLTIGVVLVLLLASLAVIPRLARWGVH